MRFQLTLLFLFPLVLLSQSHKLDSNVSNRFTFEMKISTFNFSYFGGTMLQGSYFYKLSERHNLGVSTGIFYQQNKRYHDQLMRYTYLPLLISFKYKAKKNYLKLEFGTNAFSFFDSDYYVIKEEKTFWPSYSQISKEKKYERNKNFLIVSPSIEFKLYKHFLLSTGFTLYLRNEYPFSYFNLGFCYQFNS
jgi:hypothetical protein